MSTRFATAMLGTMGMISAWAAGAAAAPVALLDPGFGAFVSGTNLTTPIANDRVLTPGSGPASNVPLTVASSLAPTTELADVPAGWTQTTGSVTGRGRLDSAIPAPGTKGFITSSGLGVVSPGTLIQTLTGVPVQPNSVYTLTVEVSDANISGGAFGDYATIPPTVDAMLFAVDASSTDLGGTASYIAPGNGGTSVLTRTVTTGAVVPGGDLTIALSASGTSANLLTTAFFDNVTLDVTPIPEPCGAVLLGLGGLAVVVVRRRSAA